MRIYGTFTEALSEIRRDLGEMGIRVHNRTYQNVDIGEDPEMETNELQHYVYQVTNPYTVFSLPEIHEAWCEAEWNERLDGVNAAGRHNPGEAYKLRPEVWNQFLVRGPDGLSRSSGEAGIFDYTYSERLNRWRQCQNIVDLLKRDPFTRQAYISVWSQKDTLYVGGQRRVPCTLGYHLMHRQGALNLMYLQRSADFHTHFQNDVWLACAMLFEIASQTGLKVGSFSHHVFSLHVFRRDLGEVF